MTSARNPSSNAQPIYLEAENFADYLSHQQEYCLFLDIDGTLADFTLNPKDSIVPNATLTLLQKIQNHGVKIVIVTGRSLTEAKQMLSPIQLPIAATHGLEIAFNDGFNGCKDSDSDNGYENVAQIDTIELAAIRQVIIESCMPYDKLIIENKPYSVALHYRQNPALADVAYTIMSKMLENYSNWMLKQGKYVWEIVPKGINKGTAILTLLKKMQTGTELCPIFIGDDITDEAGFFAVQSEDRLRANTTKNKTIDIHRQSVKGIGIKVGNEPTCAHYCVHNIYEVGVLLNSFLNFCQKCAALTLDLADVNPPLPKKQRDMSYEPFNRLI